MLIVHILQRIITFIVRQTNKIIKFRWKTGSFTKTCIICIMSTLNLSRTSNFHILNMKFIFTFVPTKEKRQTFDISILVNIAYWYIYTRPYGPHDSQLRSKVKVIFIRDGVYFWRRGDATLLRWLLSKPPQKITPKSEICLG